jgi:hypothetical protein
MSRREEAWRAQQLFIADAKRQFHERPNEPPTPFDPDPDAWESRCAGNRTMHHLAPTAKLADRWRCGSCARWLRPPVRRTKGVTTHDPQQR